MSSVAVLSRRAFGEMVRRAGTDCQIQQRTFLTENSMSTAGQWTVSSSYHTGILSNQWNTTQSASENNRRQTMLTLDADEFTIEPDVRTIVVIGSNIYRVVKVANVQGALYELMLDGPTRDATVVSGDTVGPYFTVTDLTAGAGQFTYTGTTNEAAHHRIRYRNPFGPWTTNAWVTAPGYVTSHSGTVISGVGNWEAELQGRDAAGNLGPWGVAGQVHIVNIVELP